MRKIYLSLLPLVPLAIVVAVQRGPGSPDTLPLAEAPILGKTIQFIEKNYVSPASVDPGKLLEESSRELENAISPLLIRRDHRKIRLSFADQTEEIPLPSPLHLEDLPLLLRQTLGFLNGQYEGPAPLGRLEPKEREYLATSGLLEGLDPHSNFFRPSVYKEFKINTKGNFGGLGIVIGIREERLTVIAPLEETPAWKAGIKAKDRIIQIGDEATINMSLSEAVEKLRGPVGSQVTVLVERTGSSTPLRFTLTRAVITIQSVAGRLLDGENGIGLIKVKNFQEDTVRSVDQWLEKFRREKVIGLILDLRNNPGGLLDQAIALADRFLASGVIVKTVSRDVTESEEAKPGSWGETVPMVVLVNEGSASASEIVAGALKYNDRALVLGHLTFGKGTVQTVYDLKDGSALKLTIAKYLTAGDHEVQSYGIRPDLEMVPIQIGKKGVNLFEDKRKEDEEKKEPPAAPYRFPYLEKSSTEEKEEESYRIPTDEDPPIRLAKEILTGGWQERLPELVQKTKSEEDQTITDALKKIGIDWSLGEKKGRPGAVVAVTLIDSEGKPVDRFLPGQSGQIKVTVKNEGTGDLYRFAAETGGEDPLFANLEFPFGRIQPGETREWSLPLEIPSLAPPRNEPIPLEFRELFGRTPRREKIFLVIDEIPLPRFAYRYLLQDRKQTGGNGNGHVDPGETVELKLRIRNLGPGEATQTAVNLKNLGGIELFLEKGRAELGSLPPGKETEALLVFRVSATKRPAEEKVSLELSIRDSKKGQELIDRLTFPLQRDGPLATGSPDPAPDRWYEPPEIRSLVLEDKGRRVKGIVTDDEAVRHLFVFVGNRKTTYLSPQKEEGPKFPFETRLELKKGMNLVTVAAQDDRELTIRRHWIVWSDR